MAAVHMSEARHVENVDGVQTSLSHPSDEMLLAADAHRADLLRSQPHQAGGIITSLAALTVATSTTAMLAKVDSDTKAQGQSYHQVWRDVLTKLGSGQYDRLLIEFCCSTSSLMTALAPRRVIGLRVTEQEDGTAASTSRFLHKAVRMAEQFAICVHAWISIPCTAGSPWKSVNDWIGVQTGDPDLTAKLIHNAIQLCTHVSKVGGYIHWAWPAGDFLWNRPK